MTDQEINIAIAEIVKYDEEKHAWSCNDPECEECGYGYKGHGREKPNYYADLNAIHEAIMSQPVEIRDKINCALMDMLDPEKPYLLDRTINSTARQRAEAFVRTLGKWKD